MTRALSLAVACIVGFLPASAAADSPPEPTPAVKLPDAMGLLASFRKACGYEKLRATKTQRVKGTFSMPAQAITASMEARLAAPNLSHVLIEIPGLGLSQEGFDGTHAWSMDPMQGPLIKDGDAGAEAAFKADYFASLDDSRFVEAETLGKVEFAGRTAWKARFQPRVGGEMILYFDVKTGLELGQEETVETPMGALPVRILHREYKTFRGMRFPTVMEQTAMGMTQVITVHSMEFDVELPPFELPAEVKALLPGPAPAQPPAPEASPAPEAPPAR